MKLVDDFIYALSEMLNSIHELCSHLILAGDRPLITPVRFMPNRTFPMLRVYDRHLEVKIARPTKPFFAKTWFQLASMALFGVDVFRLSREARTVIHTVLTPSDLRRNILLVFNEYFRDIINSFIDEHGLGELGSAYLLVKLSRSIRVPECRLNVRIVLSKGKRIVLTSKLPKIDYHATFGYSATPIIHFRTTGNTIEVRSKYLIQPLLGIASALSLSIGLYTTLSYMVGGKSWLQEDLA